MNIKRSFKSMVSFLNNVENLYYKSVLTVIAFALIWIAIAVINLTDVLQHESLHVFNSGFINATVEPKQDGQTLDDY